MLISVTDYTEDTPVGDLVGTVLDAVNEYQSRASGADIAYKMSQKIMKGGSVGRAPLGYLNVREKFEGREIRTIAIDPERGPLVHMAFELYATGTYGFHDLKAALTDAGLRTKPTKRHRAGAIISIHKIGSLLRDRYYLGYVNHKGVEYKGRHEQLISQQLFDKVQDILNSQRGGGTRARTYHHYLKGTVWCHRCKRRLIIMRGKNKRGDLYFYYLCRGRQTHTCDLPYLPVADVEEAVARHYTTIAIPADLRARITKGIDTALADTTTTNTELINDIKQQITKLDTQEDQFLDLVGDPDWPKEKIAQRLRKIRDERTRLEQKITRTTRPDLNTGRATLHSLLELLEQPDKLYEIAGERARKVLNQAIFTRLYLDTDQTPHVRADALTAPFAPLITAHRTQNRVSGGAPLTRSDTAADDEDSTTTLLTTALTEGCSSNVA